MDSIKVRLAKVFISLSKLTLGATIILIPIRYRFLIQARPFEPIYTDYTDFLLFGSDVSLLITLSFWAISLGLNRRKISLSPALLTFPLLAMILIGGISIFTSVDPPLSVYHTFRLIALAGFYLYLVNEIKSLKTIIIPIFIQVYIQVTIGIGQIIQQQSLGLQGIGELELNPDWRGISIVMAEGGRSLRAYGLTDHPNILGGSLTIALLIIAGWYLKVQDKWRVPTAVLFCMGLLGLFLTYSRAAWLAMALGFIFLSLSLLKIDLEKITSWIYLLLAGSLVLFPFIWHYNDNWNVRLDINNSFNTVTTETDSLYQRSALFQAANTLFGTSPLTGVGLGAFPTALQAQFPDFNFDYQPVHNVLLEVTAETGLFGGLNFLLVTIAPWLIMWIERKRLKFSFPFLGISAALLATTVVGLFDYYMWLLIPGRLWQWLIWGIWAAILHQSRLGFINQH